ncbi:DNA recombination mediator protein A [Clostridium aceticum]|uniref:DNA recombination mediator protein A n=1 Tax=Clostridium aceticum TaxID=84022 RepID=A0A0D8I6S1_9CLOT|nr:DNA-processing protein DprA [Clostridium aceticum]AKL95493.1 DNA recombination mediator protein A [Clostridium aceticum]KJF25975.1 DNA processing protein DprA [Clostridium aceticum]
MINERNLLIWLNFLGSITYEMVSTLINYFGSLEELWYAKEENLYQAMNNHRIIAKKMLKTRNEQFLQKLIEGVEHSDFEVITILDKDYPKKLKCIYNLPYVIYMKGKKNFDKPLIAIVGARKSTAYGRWAAKKFAVELAEWGVGTVSGLALGIDAEGHKGTLQEKGYTVGVLGCGIDQCYPQSNYHLYKKMEEEGCILSEYGPKVQPLKHHFPARNRIISGLSDGVVVIEAGEKSGTLITVDHALQQGKDVYALPGNINNNQSKGTNKLIKEGAKILLGIEDIIEEIKCNYTLTNLRKKQELQEVLSNEEMNIFQMIKEEPLHIDRIAYKSGISISQLNTILTILELKGFICQLPGKTFTANK